MENNKTPKDRHVSSKDGQPHLWDEEIQSPQKEHSETMQWSNPSDVYDTILKNVKQAWVDVLSDPTTINSLWETKFDVARTVRNEKFKKEVLESLQEYKLTDLIALLDHTTHLTSQDETYHEELPYIIRYIMYDIVGKILLAIDIESIVLSHEQIESLLYHAGVDADDVTTLKQLTNQYEDKFLDRFGEEYHAKFSSLKYVLRHY